MAAAKGFTTIASILLVAGADVNAQDDEGHTPLHVAGKNGLLPLLSILCENLQNTL